jgi:hypothetical protein
MGVRHALLVVVGVMPAACVFDWEYTDGTGTSAGGGGATSSSGGGGTTTTTGSGGSDGGAMSSTSTGTQCEPRECQAMCAPAEGNCVQGQCVCASDCDIDACVASCDGDVAPSCASGRCVCCGVTCEEMNPGGTQAYLAAVIQHCACNVGSTCHAECATNVCSGGQVTQPCEACLGVAFENSDPCLGEAANGTACQDQDVCVGWLQCLSDCAMM